jgi:hypothetical protein
LQLTTRIQGAVASSGLLLTTPTLHFSAPGTELTTGNHAISYEEVQKHKSADDCWVIIDVRYAFPGLAMLVADT